MKRNTVDNTILQRAESELALEERLLWIGQPSPLRMLARRAEETGLFVSLIIVFLLGIMAAYVSMTSGDFGSPILLLVLLMLLIFVAVIAPLLEQYIAAKNTVYAITTERILIIEGRRVNAYQPQELDGIQRITLPDGLADIVLKREEYERILTTNHFPIPHVEIELIGFFGIERGYHVESLLLDTFGEQLPPQEFTLPQDGAMPDEPWNRRQTTATV